MGLNFDPVGGGMFKQALKQVIEAERLPVKTLETRKSREEAKLKLFQDFKSKFIGIEKTLEEFTNFSRFRELRADLGDGANFMSVTIDKDHAEPGTYSIQIDQLASRTSILSNGFEDPDDPVLGIGFIVVNSTGGDARDIFIDEQDSSLKGVANLINKDVSNPIRASVIKDMSDPEHPWRLMLAGKKDGANEHISFPDFYFLDGTEDFYIDNENESRNALLYLDEFPVEAESNVIKDFITGVTVHLKAAKPDQPFTLSITEDYEKISGKVKGLVDQINGILDFINKQNQVDEHSDTKTTFAGDTGMQTIEYRLRNLMHEGFPAGDPEEDNFQFVFLNQMGIEFDKSGKLVFKEDKFKKNMETNFDGIAEAITGKYGFANQTKEVISGYTRTTDGMLSLREQSLRSRIKQIDNEIEQKEHRIELKEKAMTEQFARLEASVGNLQRQQQYLSATLPGAGGGGNLVSQLLGGG